MSGPKVTAMMAVYNVEPFLEEALASVLAQTWTDFEIVAIDDGSTDRCGEILRACRDPRLHVVRQENRGIGAARRRCLELARGEYIAVCDPDDVHLPQRFARQVAYLDAHPEVVVLGGQYVEISEAGEELCACQVADTAAERVTAALAQRMAVPHPTSMFRRAAALEAGNYAARLADIAEDFDLFRRLVRLGQAANLPQPLIRRRIRRNAACTLHWDVSSPEQAQRRGRVRPQPGEPPERAAAIERSQQGLEAIYLCRLGRAALRGRRWAAARHYYAQSARLNPLQWLAWTGWLRGLLHVGAAPPLTGAEAGQA